MSNSIALKTSSALIGDSRFSPPLSSKDSFNEPTALQVDVNIFALKIEAEESAIKIAESAKRKHDNQSIGQQVLALLQSSKYRRGKASCIDRQRKEITCHIEQIFQRGDYLDLLISFFPCKVRQPLKTFAKTGGEIDLGEIASLLRFYEIVRGIEHLSGSPARFIIFCDGYRYQSCFEDSNFAIQQYKSNLLAAIRYLKLEKYIVLEEEMELLPSGLHFEIEALYFNILHWYFTGSDAYQAMVAKLIPNIILNIDIDPLRVSREDMHFFIVVFLTPICKKTYLNEVWIKV